MDFSERAKRIVLSVIAVALNATAAVVERMLPFRPEWLERIKLVAAELAAVDAQATERAGGAAAPRAGGRQRREERDLPTVEQLLAAYDILWEFSQKARLDGLSLDAEFCARIEKEWSPATLVNFMQSADSSLKERAGQAQTAARAAFAR